jgi:hypothetical protein
VDKRCDNYARGEPRDRLLGEIKDFVAKCGFAASGHEGSRGIIDRINTRPLELLIL